MNYRLLQQSDFNKGFLELLKQLTTVGNISQQSFYIRFLEILKNKNHHVYVLEKANKIVSCATLFVEPKFIHSCGFVGHIEDVVVDKACRGQKLGKKIINFLTNEAERLGCYKILLDCSDKNVGFYEKCQYLRKGAYMAKYLNPVVPVKVKRSAFGNVMKFCKRYQTPIAFGVGVSLAAGYFLYQAYTIEDKSPDEEESE